MELLLKTFKYIYSKQIIKGMKLLSRIFLLLFVAQSFAQNEDSIMIRKIYSEILTKAQCYANLDYLANKIGGRLSGSPQAQKAVEWAVTAMKAAGCDTVFKQECMVPHWVRGEKEVGKLLYDAKEEMMAICALGGSVATPKNGITAPVVEVKSLNELADLGTEKIKGKIIFFNRPFDQTEISTYKAYGKAVDQRFDGPSMAAKYGALATVCRSMTSDINDVPHTGAMKYKDSLPKIPACAISTLGAERLSELLKKDSRLKFYLRMTCETLPDEKSYNVVGELKGSEHPEEIIVVGGHLDSWDTGSGAHDDGAGVVQSIEVIHVMKMLGIHPKRTIRAVAFMNEENGVRGGNKYAELAKQNNEKHILAMESDGGGASPRGLTMSGFAAEQREKIKSWQYLFLPYGVYDFSHEGGGTDISPLKRTQGTPLVDLFADPQRYFDYHHSPNDQFSAVNKRELELGAATMASFIYLVSTHGL